MLKNEIVLKKIVNHFYKQYDLAIIYSIFSNVASNIGMVSLSEYIFNLSNDKTGPHAKRLMDYFNAIGLDLNQYPKKEFKLANNPTSIYEIICLIHQIEYDIRIEINSIAKDCIDNSYFEGLEFLNWFIKDGLKDFNEIDFIKTIFDQNKSLSYIQIDVLIKSYLSNENN